MVVRAELRTWGPVRGTPALVEPHLAVAHLAEPLMPRCTLRCWDPTNCGEPCVDRYESSLEDQEPPNDWGD